MDNPKRIAARKSAHGDAVIRHLKDSVSLSTVIGETLQLARSGRQFIANCPFHDEKDPSFTVYEDHYHCYGCSAHGDIFNWLMAMRRLTFSEAVSHLSKRSRPSLTLSQPVLAPNPVPAASSPRADVFFRCWNQAVNPTGTIVETYLLSRGGLCIPTDAPIRFHPHCQRGPCGLPGGPEYWPAMLSLMTHPITAHPVGLHRTYLLPDGSAKAPVTSRGGIVLKPKMILGTWGIVRLAPEADVGRAIAITEGIENALTVTQLIGWRPAWAVGTQDCVKKLPLLPCIEALTIFADADDNGVGLAAARTCATRWDAAQREAIIYFPPEGLDWNDAVQRLPHEFV